MQRSLNTQQHFGRKEWPLSRPVGIDRGARRQIAGVDLNGWKASGFQRRVHHNRQSHGKAITEVAALPCIE